MVIDSDPPSRRLRAGQPVYEWSGVCVGPNSPRWENATGPALQGLCCKSMVHPTAAGYLRMASAFALAIAEKHRQ